MARKTIVVVMNCQGHEMIRYLRSSFTLSSQYDFVYISNIVLSDDVEAKKNALSALSTAHVVICQNVSSVDWLQNDSIAQNIPPYCRMFRFCFWRFHGYWPISAEKFHPQMWYVGDEVPGAADVGEYLQTAVPRAEIVQNFEEQVEKFAYIERVSELKMLPFFLENYKTHKMFTDEWHPTSMFFHRVACYIISELGFEVDITLLAEDGRDNFRHRLVFDSVSAELGLAYDQTVMSHYDVETDRETFFEYCRFAGRHFDRTLPWTSPDKTFQEWCYANRIDAIDYDVSRFGREAGPSNTPSQAAGAIPRFGGARALFSRSGTAPDCRWAIDLRAFRQVGSIDLWLDEAQPDRDIALALMSSTDGRAWRELTVIRDAAGSRTAGDPVTLAFREPVLARYMRLHALKPGGGAVDSVKVRSRVVARTHPG